MISEEKIKEFQRLYKAHFEKELSFDEAYEKAAMLLQLMRCTYKPIAKEEYESLQRKNNEKTSEKI